MLKTAKTIPFCPCCHSAQVSLSFQKAGTNFYSCDDCEFTFIWPWPDEKTLQARYEDYGRQYYSLDGLADFLLSADHYRRELELLSRASRTGTLLDVGCSVGGFVKAAGDRGYQAEGMDISKTSVAVGQATGLRIQAGDFLSSPLPSKFDVITMWATLEHVTDPNRYILRARELLRPGGVLLASVPNFSGITQRLIGKKDRYVGDDHLNYWTARAFPRYFQRLDFEVLETVTFSFNPLTLVRDMLNGKRSGGCEQMAMEQKKVASWKKTWIAHAHHFAERLLNLGSLGDSLAIAARPRG